MAHLELKLCTRVLVLGLYANGKTIIHDQICTQLGIYKIWSKINYEEDEIDEPLFKIRLINFIANPAFCLIFNWKKNKQEETEFVHIAHSNAYLMENKHKSIILYPFSLPLSKQKGNS